MARQRLPTLATSPQKPDNYTSPSDDRRGTAEEITTVADLAHFPPLGLELGEARPLSLKQPFSFVPNNASEQKGLAHGLRYG
jgi:hypothetical protein